MNRADLLDRINRLETALRHALEWGDEGWSYADEFYREKWGYLGQRQEIADALDEGES